MTALDGYVLERVIGRGSSGTVWRARGPGGRRVALKRVHAGAPPGAAERLRREATVLASLDHPNIVAVLDVLDAAGEVAIVMPLAEGGTLADLLTTRGALPPADALAVVLPLADALASTHLRGVLHRDVSPRNVLLTRGGVPLLTDFGGAVAEAGSGGGPGTPGCVDPAVLDGAPATAASDVHALAAVAYALLSGRFPYDGADGDARIEAARSGRRELLSVAVPDLPPALTAVLDAALDPDPARRPADGAAFAAALRTAVPPGLPAADTPRPRPLPGPPATVGGTVEFGPAPPRPRPVPSPAGRGQVAWPAGAAALALAVLALECAGVPPRQLPALLAWQAPAAAAGLIAVARRMRQGRGPLSDYSTSVRSRPTDPARLASARPCAASRTRSRSVRPNGLVRYGRS